MTGAEAVVLGYIVAAFAIFATTLVWVSSGGRRRFSRPAADDEAGALTAARASAASVWQPRRL